jgi:hypothetical protein
MAQNQIIQVKTALIAAWSEILPDIESTGRPVGCDYSWPGAAQRLEHIWFHGARTLTEPRTIKAGRRMRTVNTSLDVVIEVHRKGKQLDSGQTVVLQQVVDARCDELFGLLDEWVADNQRLTFDPSTDTGGLVIDWADFESVDLEHGPTENGCAARNVARLSYQARIL